MKRDIVTLADKDNCLYDICTEVDIFNYKEKKNMQRVVHDLLDTLKENSTAVGLAGPQIGETIRVFVFTNNAGHPVEIVNPVIVDKSEETTTIPEGCLSEPGIKVDSIPRSIAVKVEGYDKNGMPRRLVLVGGESIIFQHEIDHLDGKLISDYEDETIETDDSQ